MYDNRNVPTLFGGSSNEISVGKKSNGKCKCMGSLSSMKISKSNNQPFYSFEFFPPKIDGVSINIVLL